MKIHIFLQKYIFSAKHKQKSKKKEPSRLFFCQVRRLFLLLIEREKEEIGGDPFTGNALGPADAGAGAVAHGAIAFDLADAGARTVAHGAVAFDFADAGAGAVADGAVAVDFSDAGT